jgi:membrane protein DedA with SNARE-associated domain
MTSEAHPAAAATPLRKGPLLAAAALALAAFAVLALGVVELPDVEGALSDLSDTLGAWTYPLVGGLAFLETGAFVGLVAPGETAVVLGGVVAAQGDVNLVAMLAIVWVAAALGDLASFGLGRRLGRPFLVEKGPRFGVTAPRLHRVERFFDAHGPKAILVGRFVGIVRAVTPFLAGATGLRLRAFLPWSVLGTGLWASAFTLAGYVFHRSFTTAADTLTYAALALAVVAAAALAWRAHRQASR